MWWRIWFLVVGFLALPSCGNSDNFGLLLDTLKIIHRQVCDDEIVSLTCPRSTVISIVVAQYGKSPEKQGCPVLITKQTEDSKNCKRPNAMQYSLLQTVVEACQKKKQCTFSTVPRSGLIDPCPSQSKYIEVTYKCRPNRRVDLHSELLTDQLYRFKKNFSFLWHSTDVFRSRSVCEGEGMTLSCNPNARIAILDAEYGRTKYEATRCQAPGVTNETCTDPHAVQTVIQHCTGKRRCYIVANNRTFNSSCPLNSKPYLKVAYACVPFGILSEKYESPAERDETSGVINNNNESYFDESEEEGEKYRELYTDQAQLPPLEDNPPPTRPNIEETTVHETQNTVAITERIPESHHHTSALLLYVGIGILGFIFIIGIIIGVRCYLSKRIHENSKNGDMYTTEAPNVYSDAFSDIDNDADISHISGTYHDPLHPDMILYKNIPGSRGTLRAMKPLCTIYPSTVEASMYGNVDYVPSHTRDQVMVPRFTRSRSNEEEMEPNVMISPRSLGAPSNNYYYG